MTTDIRQTKEYSAYMTLLGWQVLQLNKQSVYVRKIPLFGAVAKLQRPQEPTTPEQVKEFCRKHEVSVFYMEPPQSPQFPQSPELKFAKNSFVPAKTIHINLTSPEHSLLKNMKHKTRYNIKIARRHVEVKKSAKIGLFCDLYKSASRQRGMWLSQDKEIEALWNAFNKTGNADLLLAYEMGSHVRGDSVIGGVLVCYSQNTAYYMYAGSTKRGKKLFAPTLLAWEAVKISKKRKKNLFDFEGVYDPRYPSTKTWKGFTKFKEGFGGEVVEYPPTLVYYRNPLLKLLGL